MTPEAERLARGFAVESRMMNPGDGVEISTRFQQYLVDHGLDEKYTQKDLADAAVAVGVPPGKVNDFLDELASWL